MEKETQLYFEEIRYREKSAITLMIILNVLFLWGYFQQNFLKENLKAASGSDHILGLPVLLSSFILFFILFQKLTLEITNRAIYVRYFPYQVKKVRIPIELIKNMYLRKFDGYREFKGYGYQWWRRGIKVYLVPCEYGLHINLSHGKRVLISTRNPKKVKEILDTHFSFLKNEFHTF